MQSTNQVVDATPAPTAVAEVSPVPSAAESALLNARKMTPDTVQARTQETSERQVTLESRTPAAYGNPNATVADPYMPRIEPRYDLVQNRSDRQVIIADLKTNVDDPGLRIEPGEFIKLTDMYTPQEINRSKGLKFALTKDEWKPGHCTLVPLTHESQALDFEVPKKKVWEKGSTHEDMEYNDFDVRFEELEAKDAKREEQLLRKTLHSKVSRKHGSAPTQV